MDLELLCLTKTLRVVKITAIILFIACMQVNAKGYSQITLSEKNAPLQKVFKEIQKQSGYDFLFSVELLNDVGDISINVKNVTLQQAIEECLKDKPLTYSIVEKTVVIKPKAINKTPQSIEPLPPNEVHGQVTDSTGAPLSGASVTVKGTRKGTTTNANGEFDLKGVDNNATLIISFTGFVSQEIKLSSNVQLRTEGALSVKLIHSNSILDQVQVIAYGTQTQRFSVGNVTTVKGEDIEKQPVSNVLLALEGRVPGLFIKQANGLPGGGVTVQIQGQNSIVNGNAPFYVIDGVPYYSGLPSTGNDNILGGPQSVGPVQYGGDPFNYINPADIESVEILKDADATAIYGSRAANGAILITTKKGKAGNTKLDINVQQGWGHVTREMHMLNTPEYLEMRHEAKANDNQPIEPTDYDINGVWDSTRYTDWQKTLIGGTAQYTNANASISGGSNTVQYLFGGHYQRQTTVFPGNFTDQSGSLHFSLNNISSNQKFHFQFSGNYIVDKNELPVNDLTTRAILTAPDAPALYDKNGDLNWAQDASGTSTWTNPLSYLYSRYKNETNNLVSSALLSYKIIPNLEISSSFGYTNMYTSDFTPFPLLSVQPEYRPFSQNDAVYGRRKLNSWIIEPQASFKQSIAKGKMNLLVGATIQENSANIETLLGEGYASDQVLEDMSAASTLIPDGTSISEYKYDAFFGRVNYIWQEKYILDATGRRDGSSRFGVDDQFHDFWSIAGGWIFSQENFLKTSKGLSFGKLKASFGSTGNDQIPDYNFLSLYFPVAGTLGLLPYQNNGGLLETTLPNPHLEWEETHKLQFGAEFGFFRDRIFLNASYSRNRSSNQLLGYNLPSIVGISNIERNFPATVQNTSWEFSISTANIKHKDFSWTSNFNLTIPRNKLIAFPGLTTSSYANSLLIGQPLGFTKAFHFLAVDPATGKYLFEDYHGNATFLPSFSTDRTVIINPFPRFYGGVQNNIRYKGLQLDFLFQFVNQLGRSPSFYNGNTYPGQFSSSLSNQPASVLNRWIAPGDKAPVAKFSTLRQPDVSTSDYFFNKNGSFIRLKNLSISWELPSSQWKEQAHIQSCRIFVQGQNLLTITRFQGMDPENQGIISLPPLRILTFGIQMIF